MEKTKTGWMAGDNPADRDLINGTSLAPSDEARLVEAARWDTEAFASLYRRYATPVYRYLYQRVGNAAEAEDLTSQVFTEALEGLSRYRNQGSFAAWLFTIARRKAIDHYRRKRPQVAFDETRDVADPQDELLENAARRENLERVAGLVERLDQKDVELLRLRFAANLSYKEIGALLKKSEAAVKMAVGRVLHRLQKEWEEQA